MSEPTAPKSAHGRDEDEAVVDAIVLLALVHEA
jgi:hypothetical protein